MVRQTMFEEKAAKESGLNGEYGWPAWRIWLACMAHRLARKVNVPGAKDERVAGRM